MQVGARQEKLFFGRAIAIAFLWSCVGVLGRFLLSAKEFVNTKVGAAGLLQAWLLPRHATVWNQNCSRQLVDVFVVRPMAVAELDWLSGELRLSRWAPTTRRSYDVWLRTWFLFCQVNGVVSLPACPKWLQRLFTWLALHCSISAMNLAATEIAAAHSHHGLPHPYKDEHSLPDLISAIKKSGMCGTRAEKFVVDSKFVVDMCKKFLEWFIVFDKDRFDPRTQPKSEARRTVLWLRAVAIVLLGLEAGLWCNEVVYLSACWVYVAGGDVELHVKLAKNGNMLSQSHDWCVPQAASRRISRSSPSLRSSTSLSSSSQAAEWLQIAHIHSSSGCRLHTFTVPPGVLHEVLANVLDVVITAWARAH